MLLHRRFCTQKHFSQRSRCYTEKPWQREAVTHTHTQQHLRTRTQSSHTHRFYTEKPLHRAACTQSFYTENFFYHKEALAQRRFSAQKFYHRVAATQRSFYREKPLHRVTGQLLNTEPATRRSFYTRFTCKCFYRRALLHRFFLREKPLHRAPFTHRRFYFREAFAHSSFDTLQNPRFFCSISFHKRVAQGQLRIV